MQKIKFKAIKLKQPIGNLFIAKINAEDLVKISYPDIRELSKERDVESYLGIQRPLNKDRAEEIKKYVTNIDATFPSSVILSIDDDNITWDDNESELTISFEENKIPAKILDGQHRVAGFMDVKTGKAISELCYFENNTGRHPFEIILTIFVGLDITEQANIFATVNLKQTKVNKSLVYDLEAYTKSRSPQKTAHDITIVLDNHDKSPLKGKIKRLGTKQDKIETISQSAFVEEIIELISASPMEDRDYFLRKERGLFSFGTKNISRSTGSDGLIFRNLFIDDKDDIILKTILSFFIAVSKKWPQAWDEKTTDSILTKTVGIKALFKVLKNMCEKAWYKNNEMDLNTDYFLNELSVCNVNDDYFSSLPATSSSIVKMADRIISGGL
ncbi:DGQHR domain-containing protein [Salmonella enterica]|nr:DGQHR domain-containing protein [Salmonella enterica]